MDKRQITERRRANGGGLFSPATRRPLRRSLSQTGKAHAACAFTLLTLAVPLAAFADDAGSRVITLDVAGGGALGAVCTALIMWLNNQRKQQRLPPLGEDVARTYATKDELSRCQTVCRKDIDDIRSKIDDNDKKAEDRARGTHARIDKIYIAQEKGNKSIGMLIGMLIGKGIAPASAASNLTTEE